MSAECERLRQKKMEYTTHGDSRPSGLLLQNESHDLLHLLGREAGHGRRCRKPIKEPFNLEDNAYDA